MNHTNCSCPICQNSNLALGDICNKCLWEIDILDYDGYSDANHMTLDEGVDNFNETGFADFNLARKLGKIPSNK